MYLPKKYSQISKRPFQKIYSIFKTTLLKIKILFNPELRKAIKLYRVIND